MMKQDYYLATIALPLGLGGYVAILTNILFAIKYEMWSELLKQTISTEFGKSLNFDKIKQQGDMMGKIFYICSFISVLVTAIFKLLTEKTCLRSNFGRNEICGVLLVAWIPSGLADSVVYKRCVFLHQLLSFWTIIAFTEILNIQYQICNLIDDKIKHTAWMFNKINTAGTPTLQYQQFSFCIKYHQYILKLCEYFDNTSRKTMGHVTLSTSVVMSFLLYNGMKGNYSLLCYGGNYLLNLAFMCHTGQKLEDAMSKLGAFIYLSRWYECCSEIRKAVPLVILRSQRLVGLQAVPIGRLNYILFFMVMKTTYTYLNLMKNTE
ncbi:uncharacterized protein [Euwallacea fornicatus]|uniref:uncharacterized protein n=1 Tax=Euwallacea fornicatus TaxID=995702 RepID=UPI00338FD8F5